MSSAAGSSSAADSQFSVAVFPPGEQRFYELRANLYFLFGIARVFGDHSSFGDYLKWARNAYEQHQRLLELVKMRESGGLLSPEEQQVYEHLGREVTPLVMDMANMVNTRLKRLNLYKPSQEILDLIFQAPIPGEDQRHQRTHRALQQRDRASQQRKRPTGAEGKDEADNPPSSDPRTKR